MWYWKWRKWDYGVTWKILILVIAQQIVEKKGENHDFARTGYVHVLPSISIQYNPLSLPLSQSQSHCLYGASRILQIES
jgi:hypothetical protein